MRLDLTILVAACILIALAPVAAAEHADDCRNNDWGGCQHFLVHCDDAALVCDVVGAHHGFLPVQCDYYGGGIHQCYQNES